MIRTRGKILAGVLLLALPVLPAVARGEKQRKNETRAVEGPAVRAVALRDLLEVAARQSPGLQRARFDYETAEGQALAAEGVDDFVLNATAEYRSTRNPIVVGNPVQTTKTEVLRLVTSLTKPLPTGGSIGVDLDLARENNNYLVAISQGGASTGNLRSNSLRRRRRCGFSIRCCAGPGG